MGVDGREFERAAGELKFAGICGRELGVDGLELCPGVDGLELCPGLVLSMEELVGDGRDLEGVEGRDSVGRDDGVEGLVVDE